MPDELDAARAQRLSLRKSMDDVERSIVSAATGRPGEWATRVGDRLRDLQAAFDRHVEITEAPDGLLEEVVEATPRLVPRVERLKKDHVDIRVLIEEALAAVQEPASFTDEQVQVVTKSVLSLLVQIVHHRHLGADVVYQAYSVDIDAAD